MGRVEAALTQDLAARMVAAEDARTAPPEVVAALASADSGVRARAAMSLGRIGTPDVVSPLIARLRTEKAPEVREALCLALGLTAADGATMVLVQVLSTDPSVEVRARAAQGLSFVKTPLATRALIDALPPPGRPVDCRTHELVWQIVVALFRHKDERAAGPLAELATRAMPAECAEVARAATWGLARLKAPRSAGALHRLARAGDPFVRAWALRGLGDLGKATAEEVVAGLGGTHLERTHAIGAAAGAHVLAAAPALRAIAAGEDVPLAVEAIHALGKLPDPGAHGLLTRLRAGAGVRARAADLALAQLAVPEREFLTASGVPPGGIAGWTILDWLGWVEALAAHPGPRARAELVRLAHLDATPEDPREVRTAAAAGALAEKGPEVRELVWQLHRADPFVRGNVVEAYAKLAGAAAFAELAPAYERARADAVEDFRVSVVQAAAASRDAAATALLTRALDDPSRNVRLAADAALRERTGRTSPRDPGPVHTGRNLASYRALVGASGERPLVRVTTTRGAFAFRLLPDLAPLTCESFVRLARRGFFDGLAIPRVVPEFVVQMGDDRGDLSGGPGYSLRCEVNGLTYDRGTVGMALSGKDTGGSQFFVMHTRHAHLEGIYTAFGRVESGMDVVDRIAKGDRILTVRVE